MKLLNILAIDIVAVALLAAAISLFGCNRDPAVSEAGPVPASNNAVRAEANAAEAVPAPEPVQVKIPKTVREVTYADAESVYNDGDYAQAANLFRRYTQIKPDNAWGHYMLGLSAWKSDDFEAADAAFRRALQLDPKHVKSMLNLSRVLIDTGKAEDALEQLYEVFEVDTESATAYRLQGRALHQIGDTTDAIQAYLDAIRIDPSDAWAVNNLGLIYIEQGNFENALPAFARAVELRDDVAIFHNNLGMALERTGRYRAAEEQYRAAVDRNAAHGVAASNLARIGEVKEEPDTPAVDIAALAEDFVTNQSAVTTVDNDLVSDDEITAATPTEAAKQEPTTDPIAN